MKSKDSREVMEAFTCKRQSKRNNPTDIFEINRNVILFYYFCFCFSFFFIVLYGSWIVWIVLS